MRIYTGLSIVFRIISFLVLLYLPLYTLISLLFTFSTSNIIVIILNLLLLFMETIGIIFAFYLFFSISGSLFFRTKHKMKTSSSNKPFFSIIIPSHGTPFVILRKTIEGALKLDYDNYEVIVSDNGKNMSVTENLRNFCEQKKIIFHHKKDDRGYKAGNINAVLKLTQGEFIVILDSDHIPKPELLMIFAPIVEDPTIGFVQAKVGYRNTRRFYQAANSILYSQFYEVIETAKDHRGLVLFNGTTGCFRKSVLNEIGGFSEDTMIEDIDTSLLILARGYKSKFINHIGSHGLVPETSKAQISQLWRWTHGACNILRIRLITIAKSSQISWSKRLELILNAMAFFSGISIVFLFTLLTLMITAQIPILRVSILGINTTFIMPSLVSVSFTITSILAVLWEDRETNIGRRLGQLIVFYLFSLGSFLFLISGLIDGLLLRNTPKSETGVWDRNFNVIRNSLMAIGFIFVLIFCLIQSLPNEFSLLLLGGIGSWIFTPLMLLWEEIFPPHIE
ncbi:MAG: glycosyltransferase [Candidatus Heimdallarchaeota archaeon]|nr:glycosyltransferase [Candidatus Heimdallarchaeota archaeon]